jgi:hypothetical protein
MKKLLFIFSILVALTATKLEASGRSNVFTGALSSGTQTTIIVTTTPIIALSTGTGMEYDNEPTTYRLPLSTTVTPGEYMENRIQIEFWNDTSTDVYVGYSIDVSTENDVNRGRRIPPQQSWSHDCSVIPHWVVASTTTLQKFTITQER